MEEQQLILKHCQEAHTLTEHCYSKHPAAKGDINWLDKRKFLLADLSLHMVQAALQGNTPDPQLIRRYLFSILTVCEDFIPDAGLSAVAKKLIEPDRS